MQVLKPVRIGILSIIMAIGIIALITELIEFEEIAKVVVIPSLILLISLSAYSILQTYRNNYLQ
jgi:ABC-type nickel/cobalt efflux system permease component RcnA